MRISLSVIISVAICSVFTNGQNVSEIAGSDREQRVFSLFSVVTFPNVQCTTLSSANTRLVMFGICQTQSECISSGGTADGSCAAGFGVCCMKSVSSCASTVNQNLTYIQNPGFPSSFTTAGTCAYTFPVSSAICQVRLDFDNFVIAQPDNTQSATTGVCTTDVMKTVSPTGYNPPDVCGTLSGSHMYIEAGTGGSSSITFTTVALGAGATRTWKIKVTFFECTSQYRAPTDCLQYFTGVYGTFETYNFNTGNGQVLASQNYNYCFRQESGYCTMNLAANSAQSFRLNMKIAAAPAVAKRTYTACVAIRLQARSVVTTVGDNSMSNSDVFCGLYLSPSAGDNNNGDVIVNALPFVVGFYSQPLLNNIIISGNPTTSAGLPGFRIDYMQVPC